MYKLLSITTDTDKKHKLVAVFENKETKRKRSVHFGQYGADDYTLKKDKGSLARYILWGDSTSLQKNITDFKNKFKL